MIVQVITMSTIGKFVVDTYLSSVFFIKLEFYIMGLCLGRYKAVFYLLRDMGVDGRKKKGLRFSI